jgi:transcriptional regulator with XRE-family HTH domain
MKAASKQNIERIAEIMKKRRVALKIKQSEAAEKAGITLGTLRKFEQTGEISLERFFKLCRLYRMDDHIMASIEQRDWWAIEEIKRAETKKTVR